MDSLDVDGDEAEDSVDPAFVADSAAAGLVSDALVPESLLSEELLPLAFGA